jgi:hypothetical protein
MKEMTLLFVVSTPIASARLRPRGCDQGPAERRAIVRHDQDRDRREKG